MYEFPLLSCFCSVYGRIKCLEEAIQCFLDQDYPGPKELVIVNDLPEQTLYYEHPQIRIYNIKKRFPTLGDKINFAVSRTKGVILVVWDDDDIYLPHHLSIIHDAYDDPEDVGYLIRFSGCMNWVDSEKKTKIQCSKLTRKNGQFTRFAFNGVGGQPRMSLFHDAVFCKKVGRKYGTQRFDIDMEDRSLIWNNNTSENWHITRVSHINWKDDSEISYQIVENILKTQILLGDIATGDIYLRPHYRHNYCELFNDFLQEQDKYLKINHANTKYMLSNNATGSDTIRSRFFEGREKR